MWGTRLYERYIGQQVYLAFIFILIAFVGLFIFFDLLNELESVGRVGYSTLIAATYVTLQSPTRFYEIIPIAALIGTIYVFAQLATHSEFTIFRVAGLTSRQALVALAKIALPIVIVTYLIGEYIGPASEKLAEKVRLEALGSKVSSGLRSGVWVKDKLAASKSAPALTRFVNVGALSPTQVITKVRIFEFDDSLHLRVIRDAEKGEFVGPDQWRLSNVSEVRFDELAPEMADIDATTIRPEFASKRVSLPEVLMRSELTPQILSVLLIKPERMSIVDLHEYIRHLEENRQDTQRYDIALWKKIVYPLTVFVMMALALPFAYLHGRSGGIGIKVFGGVMLGMSFQLLNTLFSHIGMLNEWPAIATAVAPGALYLVLAMIGMLLVERH